MAAPSEPLDIPTAGELGAESPLTEDTMQKLRKSLTNLSEQLSGGFTPAVDHDHDNVGSKSVVLAAGSVDQTAIGSSAVGQDELKASAGSASSVIVGVSSSGTLVKTGGAWSWHTLSSTNPSIDAPAAFKGIVFGAGDTVAGTFGFFNAHSSLSKTVFMDELYILASPPYDLGDGEIPLFICVAVNSNGEIVGSCMAPDPIWAYNGPTNIVGKLHKDGKTYQEKLILPPELEVIPANKLALLERAIAISDFKKTVAQSKVDVLAKRSSLDERIKAGEEITAEELEAVTDEVWKKHFQQVEVTQAIKNADMNLIKHPWGNTFDGQDVTILYLDSVSDMAFGLREMLEQGEDIRGMLLNGDIRFDNVELGRGRPEGTMSVAMSLR